MEVSLESNRGDLRQRNKQACSYSPGLFCGPDLSGPPPCGAFKRYPEELSISFCVICVFRLRRNLCPHFVFLIEAFEEDKSMSKRISSVICLALILFLVLPYPSWAWSGKVIGVADGDTITVLRDKQSQKIRLYGIDCPEKRQPFGKKAKKFTSDMVFGKTVEVNRMDTDRYGRTVALVAVDELPRTDSGKIRKHLIDVSGAHEGGR